jgi:urea transport system permease protein
VIGLTGLSRTQLIIALAVIGGFFFFPLYAGAFRTDQLGLFLCYVMFALSLDLIWGFTGILSLGNAIYFGGGAYFIGLALKLQYAATHATRYGEGAIPDFMTWNGLTEVPRWMRPLQNVWFAAPAGVLAMGFLAFVFGVITFKRHIYGVYCAVITLAESLIFEELIIEKQAYTGGFNGITDYDSYSGNVHFYWVILAMTVFFFWLSRKLTTTHFGMVLRSIRENELRSEFFGFEVANYKIFVFTVAAMMSAVAGGLYAALNGIVSHQDIGPILSIEGVIWVAVGGRGTLIGSMVGAILVKGAQSLLSEQFAWIWDLLVGLMFILIIVLMPDGIMGALLRRARRRRAIAAGRIPAYEAARIEETPTT